jgi:hypothetical protein
MLSQADRQIIAQVISRIENWNVEAEQVKAIRVEAGQVFVTFSYCELRVGADYFRQVVQEIKAEQKQAQQQAEAEAEVVEQERRETEGSEGVIDGGSEVVEVPLEIQLEAERIARNLFNKLYSMPRL